MSDKYWFLVKFRRDWADEFDVYGFVIFSEAEWINYQNIMYVKDQTVSWNFGTNEGWEDEPTEEILADITVKLLTLQEAKFLYQCFGSQNWGHFPTLDNFEFDKESDYPCDIEKEISPRDEVTS